MLAVITGGGGRGLRETGGIWPGTTVYQDEEQQRSASFNHSNAVTQIQVDVLSECVCVCACV